MLKLRLRKATPFLVSVGLHSTLVAATFLIATQEDVPKMQESRVVLVLSSYVANKVEPQAQEAPKPQVKKEEPKKMPQKEIVKKQIVKKQQTTPQQAVQKKEIVPPAEAFAPQKSHEVAPTVTKQEVSRAPIQQEPFIQDKPTPSKQISPQIDPATLGQIRFMIQNSLIYPAMARRLKIEGVVFVAFTLTCDGRVKSATVEQKSGSTSLDSKALETVLGLSGEYPKLQKEMQLKIPIAFSLKHS